MFRCLEKWYRVRDRENMEDVVKSSIQTHWASAESFWQHVAKQFHPGNMHLRIIMKQNHDEAVHD